jgi:hypothetical protein
VEKRTAGSCGLIYDSLRKLNKIFAVVVFIIPDDIDESGPSSPKTNHAISFSDRPECHGPDCRVESGYITSAS